MTEHIEGLVAPPPVPLNADGEVNYEMIPSMGDFLARNRVRGAFVSGTTGESMSLTVEERIEIAARWVRWRPEGFKIIVHVGHTCLKECQRMASHAQSIGADAIAAMPPIFFKPKTIDTLVEFCSQTASAAADLPFYYYHLPSTTGVYFEMVDFLRLARKRIANLAGMKFTCENLMDFKKCLDLDEGRFNMLFGRDEILLSAMAMGAAGAVGTSYNFAAPLYLKMIESFNSGRIREARDLQQKSIEMISAMKETSCFTSAVKCVMAMLGVDCGPVRSPLPDLTEAEGQGLKAALEGIGFFDYCCR